MFTELNGLSGDAVSSVFEDREGSVWVSTSGGLDRFREFAVTTYSVGQGLSSSVVWSVLAATDGSIWLGTEKGLNRWNKGHVTQYNNRRIGLISSSRETVPAELPDDVVESLFQDGRGRIWISTRGAVGYLENERFIALRAVPGGIVEAITEDTGRDLWIANRDLGLFRVRGGGTVQQIPWSGLGRTDFASVLAGDPLKGGLWIGFFQSGVAYVNDGQVRASYAARDGLGDGIVTGFHFDRDGAVWVSTEGGLSRLKHGRVATLSSKNGLPCDAVHGVLEDDDHAFWLDMACGLVRIARSQLDAWVTAAGDGRAANFAIQATVFDNSDGITSRSTDTGLSPRVARSSDGKLWFVSANGAIVVDPRHLPFNDLAPPVHIEQITADRTTHDAGSASDGHLPLPPLIRDLKIDYTALSFVAPEKVRFRYKLEGWDRDWQDVGTRRQAFYNNLPPRNYRFRVTATNNSGVWNDAGASLDFSISPAYYQTTWFRSAVVAAGLALLWVVYQFRLRQIAYEFDARLQERVNERTRIARDLHDTLLQSFHGLLFRFQAATNRLPDSDAKKQFESSIDQAAQAITEGRDAVHNLRSSTVVTNDLALAISTLGEELAASQTAGIPGSDDAATRPTVDVAVEGTPRDLHPILRDDLFRIAGEALRNAFRHAQARHIEVEIRYDDRQMQVRIRDDGKGIDPALLQEQRAGHFGLPGMRERADLIGGHLNIWSQVGLGTEVELTVPAVAAYASPRVRGLSWLFARRTGTSS